MKSRNLTRSPRFCSSPTGPHYSYFQTRALANLPFASIQSNQGTEGYELDGCCPFLEKPDSYWSGPGKFQLQEL